MSHMLAAPYITVQEAKMEIVFLHSGAVIGGYRRRVILKADRPVRNIHAIRGGLGR